jgi:hypothetical protein
MRTANALVALERPLDGVRLLQNGDARVGLPHLALGLGGLQLLQVGVQLIGGALNNSDGPLALAYGCFSAQRIAYLAFRQQVVDGSHVLVALWFVSVVCQCQTINQTTTMMCSASC